MTGDEALDETVPLDAEAAARMAGLRPELERTIAAVLRASAARGLFGAAPAVLVGRYELLRLIGAGGGGAVFVARDPELGREVAVKLLAATSAELEARAVAEGQALARLSHPNVVAVFDVGTFEDRVYLVMELVRGESLRAHAAAPRRLREIVRVYRQAGEGLAAAHAAGLVHRDFKPDNAVIGADGRVRVIDFGLAITAGHPGEHLVIAGTPRYMAPEQRRGEVITPACDQFAFAASLREGAVASGAPSLPRWLEAIVRRGCDADPTARYPSMSALLHDLARDPATRWRRRAAVGVPLAFAVVGFLAGRGGEDPEVRCDGARALAPAWSEARAAAAQAHVAALASAFATAEAPRLRAIMDDYARRWIAGHDAGCEAQRSGALSTPMRDLQVACLASSRTQLEAAIDLVTTIDGDGLPAAGRAISELPDLERCADPAELTSKVPPPLSTQVQEVAAVGRELDRVEISIEAARPDAVALSAAARDRARAIGYRPLLARALLAVGRAELALDRRKDAHPPLQEATEVALTVGDDAVAVEAFALAMWTKSRGGRPAEALHGLELIAALAERLGPRDQFPRALLHNYAGTIAFAAGNRDAARAHLATALAIARDVTGAGAVELAWVRLNLAIVATDPDEKRRLYDEAIAIYRDRLGEDHPLTLSARYVQAYGDPDPERARASLRTTCGRLAALHPTHKSRIVECAAELAWLDLAFGTREEARASAALVMGAADAQEYRDHIAHVAALARFMGGDAAGAARELEAVAGRLSPEADTPWWGLMFAGEVELSRAMVARGAGDRRAAGAAVRRGLGYLERAAAVDAGPAIVRRLLCARRLREATESR